MFALNAIEMNFTENNNSSLERESAIRCIFFAEFHPTAGPKIMFQTPNDYVSKESFDTLKVFLIPKIDLHGKLITVNALDMKIIGFPVGITNHKYTRNRIMFNLCFVCSASLRTTQYEPIVRKLANYLTHLEVECDFLSNESKKNQLLDIMTQIREKLNANRVCSIEVSPSTTIHLKVVGVEPEPIQVQDYHVPIFVRNDESIVSTQLDLTTQQWDSVCIELKILPYIDGFSHVSRIASEADVEVSLVKACIQHMIYYGVIALIPIFQYSNTYVTTPLIVQLAESISLQDECLRYVAKSDTQHLPTFRSVFQLYCSMNPGMTVKDLCSRFNPSSSGIDERKLIRFGLIKGFIRRIQKYPIFLGPKPASIDNSLRGMYGLFDGNHSYDEICCTIKKSYNFLEERVEKHPAIAVCWK